VTEPIFLHINSQPAEILERCMRVEGLDEVRVVGEALVNHGWLREQMWAGGKLYVSHDEGATMAQVTFPAAPPTISNKPKFLDWLTSRWWSILLFSYIWATSIVLLSALLTVLISGQNVKASPISFAVIVSNINLILCGGLFIGLSLYIRRQKKPATDGDSK